MSFINNYVYTVCITLIIITVISTLTPSGSSKGIMKAVLSVFIMISFIVPLKDAKITSKLINYGVIDEINETEVETESESYERIISENIKQCLNEGGFEGSNISLSVDVNSDKISIDSVNVIISDEYSKDDVQNYIFDRLGINAEVNYVGE